jgi:rhomboid protease GluP
MRMTRGRLPDAPPLVIALVGICLLAYLVLVYRTGRWTDFDAEQLLTAGASAAPALAAGERWRLISAIFLHGSLAHLLANLIVWWEIGRRLIPQAGNLGTAAILLPAGIAGFLLSAALQPDTVSTGLSGALVGAIGFLLAGALRRGKPWGNLAGFLLIVALAGMVVPDIDNAAHAGGLLAGTVLGAACPTPLPRRRIAAGAGLSLLLLAASFTLPADWAVPYREAESFETAYRAFADTDAMVASRLKGLGERSTSEAGLPKAEALDTLRHELMPPLAAAADALRARRYTTDWIDKERQLLAQYAALRVSLVRQLALAIDTDDAAEMARFERLRLDTDALAAEISRPRTRPQGGSS